MFSQREDNFFKTCTDKQVLACAYAIKEDKEEGNLTRAIATFGRTLVNKALFGDCIRYCAKVQDISTYDERGNIDCVNCTDCITCFKCVNCQECANCFNCINCKSCFGCDDCDDCYGCTTVKNRTNCRSCMFTYEHGIFCSNGP